MHVQYRKKHRHHSPALNVIIQLPVTMTSIKHVKRRHTNTPAAPNLPPKIAHLDPMPNIIDPPTNDYLLQDIEQQEMSDMLSTQAGFGVSQMTPADENILEEVRNFFQGERPWGTDRNVREIYVENFLRIRNSDIINHR